MLWNDMTTAHKKAWYELYLIDFKARYGNKRTPLTFDEYDAIFKDSYYPVR